jgi:hypothetical protein
MIKKRYFTVLSRPSGGIDLIKAPQLGAQHLKLNAAHALAIKNGGHCNAKTN